MTPLDYLEAGINAALVLIGFLGALALAALLTFGLAVLVAMAVDAGQHRGRRVDYTAQDEDR